MQLGGDVREQTRKSFLLLLCILLKYARRLILHFLVTCVNAVRLELPRLKTAWGKKVVQTQKDSQKSQLCDDQTYGHFHIIAQIKGKIRPFLEKALRQPKFTHNLITTFILGSKPSQNRTVLG